MTTTRSSSTVRRRPSAVVALLLHVLVAVLLPAAGSSHELALGDQRVHIEQQGGSPSCPRGHDDHECMTCRLATAAFLLATGCRQAEIDTAIQQAPAPAVTTLLARLLQTAPPSTRAPPHA